MISLLVLSETIGTSLRQWNLWGRNRRERKRLEAI